MCRRLLRLLSGPVSVEGQPSRPPSGRFSLGQTQCLVPPRFKRHRWGQPPFSSAQSEWPEEKGGWVVWKDDVDDDDD